MGKKIYFINDINIILLDNIVGIMDERDAGGYEVRRKEVGLTSSNIRNDGPQMDIFLTMMEGDHLQ